MSCNAVSSRSVSTNFAPLACSCRATSAPIPRAPPVMKTTLPLTEPMAGNLPAPTGACFYNEGRAATVLRRDGEQLPVAGHPLQLMCAAVLEFQSRSDHQVAQRARHQHLLRSRQGSDPCADVDRDAADIVAANFTLAGVQSGTHLDAERGHRVANRHGAPNRSLRPVERRNEAVAQRGHL